MKHIDPSLLFTTRPRFVYIIRYIIYCVRNMLSRDLVEKKKTKNENPSPIGDFFSFYMTGEKYAVNKHRYPSCWKKKLQNIYMKKKRGLSTYNRLVTYTVRVRHYPWKISLVNKKPSKKNIAVIARGPQATFSVDYRR